MLVVMISRVFGKIRFNPPQISKFIKPTLKNHTRWVGAFSKHRKPANRAQRQRTNRASWTKHANSPGNFSRYSLRWSSRHGFLLPLLGATWPTDGMHNAGRLHTGIQRNGGDDLLEERRLLLINLGIQELANLRKSRPSDPVPAAFDIANC